MSDSGTVALDLCESCDEVPARLRVEVCDMENTVLDVKRLCLDCAEYTLRSGTISVQMQVGDMRKKE